MTNKKEGQGLSDEDMNKLLSYYNTREYAQRKEFYLLNFRASTLLTNN